MKRILILTIVLLTTLAMSSPALAAPTHGANAIFTLKGKIISLDAAANIVTVAVLQGNQVTRVYIGQNLPITTNADTRFLLNDGISTIPISYSDLKVDDQVSVLGKLVKGTWTAARITVDLKAPCP